MKPIDFDKQYEAFAEQWIRDNRARYKNMDDMEAHLPDLYLRFLNAPADWLDGDTPGAYFHRYTSAEELVDLLKRYEDEDVPVPDVLLERISELGGAAIPPLMAVAADGEAVPCLRMTALNLLIELEAREPTDLCLDLVSNRAYEDELADVAAELLEARGREAVPAMLARLEGASGAALCTFLDCLCNFPGDERIYTYTLRQFRRDPDKRALYASYLAKLGDERAIEPLKQALALSELNYLDYIEIRAAIEALGGEIEGPERDFSGDPYYESIRRME